MKIVNIIIWNTRVVAYLKHLSDLLSGQVDVEFVEELVNLSDAQSAIPILVCLRKGLLEPHEAMLRWSYITEWYY